MTDTIEAKTQQIILYSYDRLKELQSELKREQQERKNVQATVEMVQMKLKSVVTQLTSLYASSMMTNSNTRDQKAAKHNTAHKSTSYKSAEKKKQNIKNRLLQSHSAKKVVQVVQKSKHSIKVEAVTMSSKKKSQLKVSSDDKAVRLSKKQSVQHVKPM